MDKIHILIVEDDHSISTFMAAALNMNGYIPHIAANGADALEQSKTVKPDLVLLDLGLPDMDGMEVLRRLRQTSQVPVKGDKVRALDEGADDYIMKPFGTSELLARIRTAWRHWQSSQRTEDVYRSGGLSIDFDRRIVELDGEEVHLTQNEYKIVTMLARSAGKVLTYDTIIREIWGPFDTGDNKILRVNMANIRRKFENNPAEPRYFFTEVGVGYRMAERDG